MQDYLLNKYSILTKSIFRLALLIWGFLVMLVGVLPAQTADTIIGFIPILLIEKRLPNVALGQAIHRFDSNTLQGLPNASLSDALLQTGGLYIKHYGPGRLATAGVRGSSAQQTAILWDDIPIMDPMLGQLDLSLLPLFFFDQSQFYFGGGSIHSGSGAVGGTLQLRSSDPAGSGWETGLFAEAGSFGHAFGGLKAAYKSRKWYVQSRFFYEQADNDFEYQTITGEQKKLPNATTEQIGVLTDFKWQIRRKQYLEASIWYQEADRALPPTQVQQSSVANQQDEGLRTRLKWELDGARSHWQLQVAYLNGQLIYNDSISGIFSESTTHSWIADGHSRWLLDQNHQLELRFQSQWMEAQTTAYTDEVQQQRHAIIGTYRYYPPRSDWQLQLAFRQEWQDGEASPFLPELKARYRADALKFFGHVARAYRWPTLNDLFWEPGGNPELLPEQGWSEEAGAEWGFGTKEWEGAISASIFARQVENWIIWLPESSFFSPRNVKSVHSWGGAPGISLQGKSNWGTFRLKGSYEWTRSVNVNSNTPNDQSLDKQLIYVPEHQWQAELSWTGWGWQLRYVHHWQGKVFTLADHSQSIPGFHRGFMSVSKRFPWKNQQLEAYLQLRNCWDTDYELVIQRPMPGRHFRLGLSYNLN